MRIFILFCLFTNSIFLLANNSVEIEVNGLSGKGVQAIKDSVLKKAEFLFDLNLPASAVAQFNKNGRVAQSESFAKVFQITYTIFLKSSGAYDPSKEMYLNFWKEKLLTYALSSPDSMFLDSVSKINILSGFLEYKEYAIADTFNILQTEDFPFKLGFSEVYNAIVCQLLDDALTEAGYNNYSISSNHILINRSQIPVSSKFQVPQWHRRGEKQVQVKVACPPNKCMSANSISPSLCISNRTGHPNKTDLLYSVLIGDNAIETQCMSNALIYKGSKGIDWIKNYFSMFEVYKAQISE